MTLSAKEWQTELKLSLKHEDDWRKRGREVNKRYRLEDRKDQNFNILWANTETLKPVLFSQTPKPDIRRRWKEEDKLARDIAVALERGMEYTLESYDFEEVAERVIHDYLLPGRAIARVRWIPKFKTFRPKQRLEIVFQRDENNQVILENDEPIQMLLDPNGEIVEDAEKDEEGFFIFGDEEKEKVFEEVKCEYVHWEDYAQSRAKIWTDVTWVAFRTFMDVDELKESFPKKWRDIPLEHKETTEEKVEEEFLKRGEIWEIWDKDTRKVYVIAKGLDDFLKKIDDPYNLQGFFPIPEPLYSVKSNDTLIPIPEFTLYQDQANELDEITLRINKLVEALRVRGIYAGSEKSVVNGLFDADENELIPVEDFTAITEKGGLSRIIEWVPIEAIGKTLAHLFAKRNELLDTIFQITGLSDIFRGASDPRETRGAQEIKQQSASRRLLPRQRQVQRFFRDIIRLKTEIMAEKFDLDTISLISGIPLPPQAEQVLRDDDIRSFRIDIETDSTVAADVNQDKQDVLEFIGAISQMSSLFQLAKSNTDRQIIKEILLWGLRRYKAGRRVEDLLESIGEQPDQPQPDPATIKAQSDAQIAQAEQQRKAQETQTKLELQQRETDAKINRENAEAEAKIRLMEREAEAEQRRKDRLNEAKIDAALRPTVQ
ncbi:MAG: hypothetical protein MJA83_15825 [Gammaproteobacteria bacterium]|nr:hypothetical protein [Gammaproteobacteria bacterium]